MDLNFSPILRQWVISKHFESEHSNSGSSQSYERMKPMLMQSAQHEIQKTKWKSRISERCQSGQTIRAWCKENNIQEGQYYYWLKVLREESLIQAGALAVTQSNRFVELLPKERKADAGAIDCSFCAKLTTQSGFQVDIYNGADEQTLGFLLQVITNQC